MGPGPLRAVGSGSEVFLACPAGPRSAMVGDEEAVMSVRTSSARGMLRLASGWWRASPRSSPVNRAPRGCCGLGSRCSGLWG